jgi:hypothetical protein
VAAARAIDKTTAIRPLLEAPVFQPDAVLVGLQPVDLPKSTPDQERRQG